MATKNTEVKTEKDLFKEFEERLAALEKENKELKKSKTTLGTCDAIVVNTAPEKMVVRKLFKDSERYSEPVTVAINGKTWLIRRGEEVEIPESVAAVLDNSYSQDILSARQRDALSDEFEGKRKNME